MNSGPEIEVYATREEAALATAEAIADWLHAGLSENDRASFVGTGGSSPGPVYDLLRLGNTVFVARGLSGVTAVDVTRPEAPRELSTFANLGRPW